MRFQDRTAVVTGGGSGIGRASARRLAAEGASVVILDRDGDAAERTAESIALRSGRATGLQVDVAIDHEVEAAVAQIHDRYGRVDVLVNNAGYLRPGTAVTQTIEDWDRTFAVNVRAMFLLSRAVLPGMVDRGVGSIVNIASTAGLVGEADNIAYATSKGAVVNLTRQLAADFSRAGIRVNCVCPGWVPTGFNDPFLRDMSEEEVQAMVEGQVPLGRQGTPEEIAAAVAFLASDEASFIVGQALGVDGGVTACR
ncbi:SDR family NAD(P)-dependent oxidoreductase [uncultured Amnibacterium sp.]|uniref:SDR family NAD(P)-dependent oxidoreductase n=1 Tax=uncultured Amnibacterium sp. TaxID=1631851 RepID=UPI0035C9A379